MCVIFHTQEGKVLIVGQSFSGLLQVNVSYLLIWGNWSRHPNHSAPRRVGGVSATHPKGCCVIGLGALMSTSASFGQISQCKSPGPS